jgi:phosphoglycolate phosphatase-like HAD superfamily hydrolase
MLQYILFDLDGTLTDPGPGITNCVAYALEKFDVHPACREELYPYIEQAVGVFCEQTGDKHIVCYLSDAIDVETEGMGAAEHPTEKTQRRCARALVEVIRTELGI